MTTHGKVHVFTHATGTGVDYFDSASSSTPYIPPSVVKAPTRGAVAEKAIESAVYAHLQAMRALGNTVVEMEDIARALSLPLHVVSAALTQLKSKGVRLRKP